MNAIFLYNLHADEIATNMCSDRETTGRDGSLMCNDCAKDAVVVAGGYAI